MMRREKMKYSTSGNHGDQEHAGELDRVIGPVLPLELDDGEGKRSQVVGRQVRIGHDELVPVVEERHHEDGDGGGNRHGSHDVPEDARPGAPVDEGRLLHGTGKRAQLANVDQRVEAQREGHVRDDEPEVRIDQVEVIEPDEVGQQSGVDGHDHAQGDRHERQRHQLSLHPCNGVRDAKGDDGGCEHGARQPRWCC